MSREADGHDGFRTFQRIDAAFRAGDLDALRAALPDPSVVPNGPLPPTIGTCLVYAVYHSPLAFIRTLLELGADPNAPADDGFPPLIAALGCARDAPGTTPRTDVGKVLRLLLSFGADPNQRGFNDYTPLHMAVAERDQVAVQILLDHGADPQLRTRIDECETPAEMAHAAGLSDIVALFEQSGPPARRRLRSGLVILADVPGTGAPVRQQHRYVLRLKLWLHKGEAVRWTFPSGTAGRSRLEDDGETLITEVRIDRRSLLPGIFYGLEGMRVGGMRRLEIAPHLGHKERGVPGIIPANALLTAEVTVLEACDQSAPALGRTP